MKSSTTLLLRLTLLAGLAANWPAHGVGMQAPTRNSSGFATVKTATDCAPPPAGIVGWWPGEGNANDIVGANNGILAPDVAFGPGMVGQGFYLGDANAYVTFPANPALDIGASGNGLTLEAWIYPNNVNAFHPIFEWGQGYAGGNLGVHLWLGSHPWDVGALYANVIDVNGNSHPIESAQSTVVANQFQHVALTYDPVSGNATLYVNGNVVAQQNIGNIVPQTSYNFYFGIRLGDVPGDWTYGAFLGGILDEPAIYNRALSANEIAAIYNAGSAGKCNEPIAPEIVTQPASQAVVEGGTAAFGVVAGGTGPLTYQWAFNDTNISGATNANLVLSGVQFAQSGNYSVLVSNAVGWVASSNAVLTVQSAPACTPPPTWIVGWWPGEGNANDIVGANNGTLEGGLGFALGEVGQAFFFNAPGEDVNIPASLSLNVGAGNGFTLEAWVSCSNVDALNPIFEWNLGDWVTQWGVHFYIGAGGPGSLYANIVDTGGAWHSFSSPTGVVAPNVFQHAALTYDETTGAATIYCNGTVVAQSNLGIFTPQTAYKLYLGRRVGPEADYGFAGLIDEPSIYNRALSAAEIAAIYNAGSAGKCNEPFPPTIITQPASQTVLAGGAAALSVVPAGTGPLTLQWTFQGHKIAGATNAWLSLTNLHSAQAGNYAVRISSLYGSITSSNALLTVTTRNLLIYKYAGAETIVTKGEELTFPYTGMMYFLPDNTNGAYVGWAMIQGKKTYWINSISQSLWLNIPGKNGQSYTLFGDAGSGFDDNGQAYFHSSLLKGRNITLPIGTRRTFLFPNTFAGENIHAYPDAQTGQMKLDQASSTFTFAAPNTQAANDSGQTLADLINAQVKILKNEGFQAQ